MGEERSVLFVFLAFAAATLPFVVAAKEGLVTLDLLFDVAEGIFATSEKILAIAGGTQSTGGKDEGEGKGAFLGTLITRKDTAKLNEVGFVALEEAIELIQPAQDFRRDSLLRLQMLIADRNVHGCTFRMAWETTEGSDAARNLHRITRPA